MSSPLIAGRQHSKTDKYVYNARSPVHRSGPRCSTSEAAALLIAPAVAPLRGTFQSGCVCCPYRRRPESSRAVGAARRGWRSPPARISGCRSSAPPALCPTLRPSTDQPVPTKRREIHRRTHKPLGGTMTVTSQPTLGFGMQLPIQSRSKLYREPWEDSAGRDELAAIAQAADRAGFSYIAVCDPVAIPRDKAETMQTAWYDTVATLGWLAALTTDVRLLSHVFITAYRHPLVTAKSFM